MTNSFYIHTFGCQMNERDSEIMAQLLIRQGLTPAERIEDAQVTLINTCHIRGHAEQRALSLLGRLKDWRQERPDRVLALTGCVAEAQGPRLLKRFPQLDIVLSPAKLLELPRLVRKVWEENLPQIAVGHEGAPGVPELTGEHPKGFKAWIKIMEGCDHHCTFCVVPNVRGRERNRPFEEIVREVEQLVDQGVVEVTLLGQTVNAYGKGDGPQRDFSALLRRLSEIAGLKRLRFTSSHPVHHTESVLRAMGECPAICEHMHLPVQSGSDRMLRAMWRGHSVKFYCKLVERARVFVPGLAITTDFIVGFPGECEEDFLATLDLVQAVDFSGAYAFKYSARPGTPAAALGGQVAEPVKVERLARLNKLLDAGSRRHNEALVNSSAEVLVEGPRTAGPGWLGRLRTNRLVSFAPDLDAVPGRLRTAEITEASSWSLAGRLVPASAPVPA